MRLALAFAYVQPLRATVAGAETYSAAIWISMANRSPGTYIPKSEQRVSKTRATDIKKSSKSEQNLTNPSGITASYLRSMAWRTQRRSLDR